MGQLSQPLSQHDTEGGIRDKTQITKASGKDSRLHTPKHHPEEYRLYYRVLALVAEQRQSTLLTLVQIPPGAFCIGSDSLIWRISSLFFFKLAGYHFLFEMGIRKAL